MMDEKTVGLVVICLGFPGMLLIGGLLLKRLVGCPCQFCPNMRITPWRRLTENEQETILAYFHEHERREPSTSAILLCRDCGVVYDDFSGESNSYDTDGGRYGCRTWCKVCNALLLRCEPERKDIRCEGCGTDYAWQEYKNSGMHFLMPAKDSTVKEQCHVPTTADM